MHKSEIESQKKQGCFFFCFIIKEVFGYCYVFNLKAEVASFFDLENICLLEQ